MSASENQADKTIKDTDDRKTDPPRNIIRIRLPPRKRLSNGFSTLSKKVPEDTNNTQSEKVPEQTIDNPSKNLITAAVQGDASSNSPREGLCNVANSNTLSKTLLSETDSNDKNNKLPEEANGSTPSKNLTITNGVWGNDASSYPAKEYLCEEANNGVSSNALLVPVKELPEELTGSTLIKNLTTTTLVWGNDASSYPTTEELCEQANNNIPGKALLVPEELTGSTPIKNLTTTTGVRGNDAISYPAKEELCEEADNNISSNVLLVPVTELHEELTRSTPSKNLTTTTGVWGNDASSYPAKEELCEEANNNIPSKALLVPVKEPEEPTGSTPSKNLTTTGVQGEEENNYQRKRLLYDIYNNNTSEVVHEEEVFEQANNHTPTKLSGEVKNKAPSNKPTVAAKKRTLRKKFRTSAVQATDSSQNTFVMKFSTSVGQAVEQSTNAANLETIKGYQEFEEKVKRTVYLDNLSYHATEAVIKSALSQFGTFRKVIFLVNYTIPYNIPQSALVEMDSEKDAESVVNMLNEFPFMISGTPRPVRAKRATAEMFNDRPRRPGSKLEFRWVGPRDPDYEILKKLKLMSRRHEVENLALIKQQLEEEKLLAVQQREKLSSNHRMLESLDSVILSGLVDHMSRIYGLYLGEMF